MMNSGIRYELLAPVLAGLQRGIGEVRYGQSNHKTWFGSAFLAVWICLWTVAGFGGLNSVLHPKNPGGQLFSFFWLAGWALGWIAATFTLVWTTLGRQDVVANSISLTHIGRVGPIKRVRHFQPSGIKDIRWVDSSTSTKGGESMHEPSAIKFDYGAKTIEIFKGIQRPEAIRLIEELQATLGINKVSGG